MARRSRTACPSRSPSTRRSRHTPPSLSALILRRPPYHRWGHLPNIFKPQVYWAVRPNGTLLPPAGRVATLAADWAALRAKHPALPPLWDARARVTPHAAWCRYFARDRATEALARRLYAVDFGLVDATTLGREETGCRSTLLS